MNYKTDVDGGLLDLAKAETMQLLEQRYTQRRIAAAENKRNRVIFESLRTFSIVLCCMLIPLSFFGLVFEFLDGEIDMDYLVILTLAISFLMFFLYWDLSKYFNPRSNRLLRAAHRKFTQSAFKTATAEAPYEATYRLEGSLIRHFRDEQLAWSLEISHFSYLGEHVALLFEKENSYYPKVLLIHNDKTAIEQGLNSYGVAVIRAWENYDIDVG